VSILGTRVPNGYNFDPGGKNSHGADYRASPETRARLSASLKRVHRAKKLKRWPWGVEDDGEPKPPTREERKRAKMRAAWDRYRSTRGSSGAS
jgi:hypothetical protein